MATPTYLRNVEGYTVPYYGRDVCLDSFTEVVREFTHSLIKSETVNVGVAKVLWKNTPRKKRRAYKNYVQLYIQVRKQAYNLDAKYIEMLFHACSGYLISQLGETELIST